MRINYVSSGITGDSERSGTFISYQVNTLLEGPNNDLEHYNQFGFKSYPRDGAEAIVVYPLGVSDNGIVICVADRRIEIDLEKGQTCVYSHKNNRILFNEDSWSELYTGKASIRAEKDGKIAIKSDAEELIKIIRDLWKTIKEVEVPTIYGPQNLAEVVAKYKEIDDKLKKFTG